MSLTNVPSVDVLERIPARALTFLRGVGTCIPVRATLAARGYTDEENDEGWRLLQAASGYKKAAPAAITDAIVMDAITTLDGWDERGLRMIKAALRRKHRAVYDFVCADLKPGRGMESVLVVAKLLGRVEALKNGAEREATRAEDAAALATLAARGFGDAEWARLAELVRVAQKPEIVAITGPATDDSSREALLALYEWYADWSEMARSLITRRDHLIRLGLARRKAKAATDGTETEVEEDVTEPEVA